MKDEDDAHDVMVYIGETLYQVVVELMIMTQFDEDDDV